MKSLLRMYVWWPGITKDIENTVRNCTACQLHQSTPPVAPLHPWSWPTRPWARLHLDYAGPFEGKMILILIDARRSRLDLLKPHTAERVEKKQSQQKEQHDSRSRERKLEVGTNVYVRNYHQGGRWLPGIIEQKTGPVSFRVNLTDGRMRRCHQDQIRKRSVDPAT